MTHEFNQTADELNEMPIPRNYEIHEKDNGFVHKISGFIGINDSYVAVASVEGRMIFGMPLDQLHYFTAIETPETHTGTSTAN